MEYKQDIPSVIAGLMGLDQMPPHQPVKMQHRVLSENYFRKIASIGVRVKRSTSKGHSFRMNIDKQQEFKDIFEVADRPKLDERCSQPAKKCKPQSSLSDAKTSFTWKQLKDVNCLSLDEKFEHLKVLDHTTELNTSREHMLRIPEMTGTRGDTRKLHRRVENRFPEPNQRKLGANPPKMPSYQNESNENLSSYNNRIIVLKPNTEKVQNERSFSKVGSFAGSQICDRRHRVYSSGIGEFDSQVGERRKVDNNMEFSKSEVSRDLNREIKPNFWSSPTNASNSGFRSDGTFADELDLMMPFSDTSFNLKDQYQSSFYGKNGPSANRESKKRVSERWKTTKRFQEVGLSNSSTHYKMLPVPFHEMRSRIPSLKAWTRSNDAPASSDIIGCSKAWTRSDALHCDWYLRPEEVIKRNKSRKQDFELKDSKPRNSRSICKSSQSPACIDRKDNHTSRETSALMNGKLGLKDTQEQSSVHLELESCNSPQNNFGQEHNPLVSFSSICCVSSEDMVADMIADEEIENVSLYFGSPKQQQFKLMHCISVSENRDNSPNVPEKQEKFFGFPDKGTVASECLIVENEYPGSSDEAFQSSPVSVLDPLLKEECYSGSECSERVGADLRGLQMQLQLLQSDSQLEAAEMIVSSDEDSGKGCARLPDKHGQLTRLFRTKGSRDFSYLVDVLDEAGPHDGTWDWGCERWFSPECPLSSSVFEVVEKKYEEEISWDKSERRLLFDRINLGFLEIFQSCVSFHTQAKHLGKWIGSFHWSREVFEEELWSLLVGQAMEATMNSMDKVFGRDTRWLVMEEEVDVIGREIESSLIDELAEEIVSM